MKKRTSSLLPEGYIDCRRMRGLLARIYIISFAAGIPYLIFVLATGIRIPCLQYVLSGLRCPACGITRMFTSLARLRFYDAFMYNPAFFILLFYWNLIALFGFAGKPEFARSRRFLFISVICTAVFLAVFAVLRNTF